MHEHNDCKHNLKYCKVCDVVYCEKCNSEWKKPLTYYYQPYTITDGTVKNYEVTVNHAHNE